MKAFRVAFVDGHGADYLASVNSSNIGKLPVVVQRAIYNAVGHNGHCQVVDTFALSLVVETLGGEIRYSHARGQEFWIPRKIPASKIKKLV